MRVFQRPWPFLRSALITATALAFALSSAVARADVPTLSGTWTGFPSDFLGMDVTVSVTSTLPSEEPSMPEAVDARRSGIVS